MYISVIIPTINREKYLKRSIESVIQAAEKKSLNTNIAELIVVNDSDQAVDVEKYDNDFILVRVINSSKAPFGGASATRHEGIMNSQAELIFILDDDDYFLPNRFDYALDFYNSHESVDVILEPSIRRNTETGAEYQAGATEAISEDPFSWILSGGPYSHIATGATSFRRQCYFDVGEIDQSLELGEDGELLLRFAYFCNVHLGFQSPIVVCERHDSNISHEKNRKYFHNMKSLMRLYKNTRDQKNSTRDNVMKRAIQAKYNYLLSICIKELPFFRRLIEVARISFYYPWRWANEGTYKSLAVALFKPHGGSD